MSCQLLDFDSSWPSAGQKCYLLRKELGEHFERSAELRLKRMTERAIKRSREPKPFTLEKDGDENLSRLERFRVRYKISKPGFLFIKLLVVVSLVLWLIDVIVY